LGQVKSDATNIFSNRLKRNLKGVFLATTQRAINTINKLIKGGDIQALINGPRESLNLPQKLAIGIFGSSKIKELETLGKTVLADAKEILIELKGIKMAMDNNITSQKYYIDKFEGLLTHLKEANSSLITYQELAEMKVVDIEKEKLLPVIQQIQMIYENENMPEKDKEAAVNKIIVGLTKKEAIKVKLQLAINITAKFSEETSKSIKRVDDLVEIID
jgi:CRISPR/Cas system-associated exonuclease Cas4 (RecB family)